MMEVVMTNDPYSVVRGKDGTEHLLWLCSPGDSEFFEKAFENVPTMYIADGHHRAASAYNVGKIRRE